jgi:hypothetical protein
MTYQKRIVLNCPSGYVPLLDSLVEDWLRAGVTLVAIVGKDRSKVEDIIDELIVGDGSDVSRFFVTSNHDSLDEAIAFAEVWPSDESSQVQMIEL